MTKTLPNSHAFADKSRILSKFGGMIKRNSLKWMAIIAVFLSFFPSLDERNTRDKAKGLLEHFEERYRGAGPAMP